MLASAASLESICKLEGIQFLSIGCLRVKENILLIPQLIAVCNTGFAHFNRKPLS